MAPISPVTAQRGTKRKRTAGKKAKAPPVKRETTGELISKKLHHGLHEVRKAAKKAAAFELQKVVKRLKAARGEKPSKVNVKSEDAAELERQLEVLKSIDHEPFANTALKTKIMKDRLLSENEDVKAAVTEKLSENLVQPQQPGSSAAKVHGRLLSSKTIADAVHAVVDSLKQILDPSLATAKAKAQSQELEPDEEESGDEDEEGSDAEGRPVKGKKARVVAADVSEEDDDETGSDDEAAVDDAGWESGTIDGDEDGAGWESGSIDGEGLRVAGSSDEDEDEDESSDGEDEEGDSAAKRPKPNPPAKDPKGKAKAVGAESTFLPSLSVGFTRGDSDASDLSEADAEAAAADLPRKNRRGQRARRAIWEKKYGRNANHVKKQQEGARPHDPRQRRGPPDKDWQGRGARDDGAPPRGRGGPHGQRPPAAGPPHQRPDRAGPASGGGKKADDKPLHPSWEAKRKLKEKLNPSIVPAQGKKIKFS